MTPADEQTPGEEEGSANVASFKEDERIAVASLALASLEMIEEEGYPLDGVLRSTARLAFDAGGVAMLNAVKRVERERAVKEDSPERALKRIREAIEREELRRREEGGS